ncbi:amidohydrolase family protein [Pseudonocardia ailaonensis]|uniref:Amidohydrolase family protein n=1 Tax=Pseudonocardia ailaonensis TaxID=367279 RepID=A0ABN2N3H2_9PSEU
MLRQDVKLISVDDHLIEPKHLWTDRLPAKYQDVGPRVVEDDEGHEVWQFEGQLFPQVGLNAVAGLDVEDFSTEPRRFEDMRPGCYEPNARLKDMDQDGVWASLAFPSFSRFCGQRFLEAKDKDLGLACVQAYNDFMLDEWSGADRERLVPLVILPLWDAELAAAEVRRTAARGAKAIAFSEGPAKLGLPSFHSGGWDPLFRAAVETDMPVCMHIGSSSSMITTSADAPYAMHIGLNGLNSMIAAVDLLWSPVPTTFPDIKLVLSEGGAGWAPYIMEKINWAWTKHRHYCDLPDTPPEEVWSRNFFLCFIEDVFAVEQREKIGIDNLMWEADYPHSDCAWPNSRNRLEEVLEDVDDDDAAKIGELNARRVFNL